MRIGNFKADKDGGYTGQLDALGQRAVQKPDEPFADAAERLQQQELARLREAYAEDLQFFTTFLITDCYSLDAIIANQFCTSIACKWGIPPEQLAKDISAYYV